MYEAQTPIQHATHACRVRVLCFHNAGSAEDMYTSEGTGARRSPNPLLVSTKSFGWAASDFELEMLLALKHNQNAAVVAHPPLAT